ncbi:MAG TPA: histidine kinase, partial [Candidatus Dormibacteraeota bacterium]|nr:histidine kinase [Candidatus Dormibacteraeota bacterium]
MTEDHLSDLREQLEAAAQAAAETEVKKHLARELHDRVAQTLTTMVVEMENFKVEQFGRQSVITGLNDLQDSTREVLNSLRRLLYELRGESVEQDFVASVQANLLTRFEERTGIRVKLSVSGEWPQKLAAQTALNLYRILDEALNNARLHSGAKELEVSFTSGPDGHLVMSVADDGVG